MNPNDSFGTRWGGYLGSKAGEFIGGEAQRLFGAITGFGDYKVKKNVFASGRLPEVVNQPNGGGQVIRFQEFLGDVITGASGEFNILSYVINPANSKSFPWLSQIACNYEQYEMEGMLFQFRSTSASALNSTNTALGSVIMATQYDVMDAPFESKTEMLNYEFSTSGKPSENIIHMIECEPRQTTVSELFTLTGAVPTGADPRLYHLGRFNIATVGFQANFVNIGELHVTYQVRLLKPKLFTSLGLGIGNFLLQSFLPTQAVYSNTQPLGLTPPVGVIQSFNTLGIDMDEANDSILFPATNSVLSYRVEVAWRGAATAITQPTFSGGNGLTVDNIYWGTSNGTTTNALTALLGITIRGNGGTVPVLTCSATGTLPVSTSGSELIIRILQTSNVK